MTASTQQQRDNWMAQQSANIAARQLRNEELLKTCPTCKAYAGKMAPTHDGSKFCSCGSIASGGTKSHCSCDTCF